MFDRNIWRPCIKKNRYMEMTLRIHNNMASYQDASSPLKCSHPVVIDARYLEGVTWFTSSREREIPSTLRNIRDEVRSMRSIVGG